MRIPTMWYVRPAKVTPANVYAQSDKSLCQSPEYSMTVKLLTDQHLEFPSLKGGCTGLLEFTLVKMPHCWKSYVAAHIILLFYIVIWFVIYHRGLFRVNPSVRYICPDMEII